MKVLVTGSQGYCGLSIVERLIQHGHQVTGFDLALSASRHLQTSTHKEICGDINDLAMLANAMRGCQAIVHSVIYQPLSPRTPIAESNPAVELPFSSQNLLTYQINTLGSFHIFELAYQMRIRQVVLLSSARVVWDHFVEGNNLRNTKFRAKADSPLSFSDQYGLSKHLQEQIARNYALEYGISVIIFRPWWVVDGPSGLNRLGQPLSEDRIPLSPTGMVCRNDLAEAVCLALQRPELHFAIYYPVAGPDCDLYFDVETLRKDLGWYPQYTFRGLAPAQPSSQVFEQKKHGNGNQS